MTFLRQITLLALAACMSLALVGCQPSDPGAPNVESLSSIAVTPGAVNLEIGGVQALTVTGTFTDGSTFVVTFGSTFVSSAPDVARVDAATGYVTALAAGTATITARHAESGKTATTTVTVAPLRVLSVAVSPATVALAVGATRALTVTATYNNATTGPVTAGSTFVSSDPTVATVDATGTVAGVAVGSATITATHTASGKTGTAAVTVSPPGAGGFAPITFDSAGIDYTLSGFGGAEDSTLSPDPVAAGNTVAKVVKSATAEPWAGTTVSTMANNTVDRIPFTATQTRMTVRVYSPRAGMPVRLKVEDAADSNRAVETEALTTRIDTWETLIFDFANPASGTAALNLAFTYDKLSIFFDFNRSGPAGGGGTFYLDDVTFVTGGGGGSGSTGTCAAPECTDFSAAGIGFSVFENQGGGTAEIAEDPNDPSNDVVKFVKKTGDNDFFGTTISGLAGPATLTAADKTVTLRVFSPEAGTNFLLKLEGGPGGAVVEKDVVTTLAGAWETLSFDLSSGATGTYGTVVIFPNGRSRVTADKTMYVDELRFPAGGGGGGGGSGSTGTCAAPECTDFSAAGIGFSVFENQGGGTAEIAEDPNDPSNDVVKFVKKTGDNDFFGTTISGLAGPATLTAADKTVTLRVFSPEAGTNFLLKLEGGPGGAVVEKDVATTLAGAWETLSFDLSSGATGTYATVVIFPNGRSRVTADKTMYVDELRFPAAGGGGGGGGSGNTGTCNAPCIDFAGGGVGYTPFEGLVSAAQADDPVDATNQVAKFVKGPSGQPWAGATIYTVAANQSVPAFDLSTNKVVTLRVYAPAAGQRVRLKLEDAANPAVYLEKDVLTTVANQWETLSFDFASPDNGTYNPANTYNRVSLFPAFSTTAPPPADVTYYFDELQYTTSGGGGGGGGPIVFASGYASNNRTVEGGEWGFYSDNFTNYSNTYAGGGFVDDNPAKPAADTYIYLVVATSAPTTDGYMGIFTAAPGYTIAAPNAGVTLNGQTSLKIELGMAAEWFQQAANKQLTVRLIGSQVYANGAGGFCQILVEQRVTPSTADLTLYTLPLASMTLAQACNGGGFTSGVNTLAEALAKPIGEVHVQAVFPQVNTTVTNGAGTEYPTGFTRGSVTFE